MKKQNYFCLMCSCTLLYLTGCSQEEFIDDASTTSLGNQLYCSVRTPQEAVDAAVRAADMFGKEIVSGASSRGQSVTNAPVVLGRHHSSRAGAVDTLMYVVNYQNNNGFALISAVRSTPELLAFVPQGGYRGEETSNPGFELFMDASFDYLENAKTFDSPKDDIDKPIVITPATQYKEIKDTTITCDMENRVRVFWGQNSPEGDLCPNKTSGCSITAVAMAMTHWNYPQSIVLTYDGSYSTFPLNWELIKKHNALISTSSHDWTDPSCKGGVCNAHYAISDEGCTSECRRMVATLCRELGMKAHTEYKFAGDGKTSSNSSGTSTVHLRNMLQKLGYIVTTKDYSASQLASDLSSHDCVMLMEGSTMQDGEKKGHMWICDAVYSYKIHTISYASDDLGITWRLNFDRTDYYLYNFYNWGWFNHNSLYSSSYNGYYNSAVFQPQNKRLKSTYNFEINVKYTKMWKL